MRAGQQRWQAAQQKIKTPGSAVLNEWLHHRRSATVGAGKRQYAGAVVNRLTADWASTNTSHDSELRSSLRTLRGRSRQLTRDNEYAKNAMRLIKNNVIGQGIKFQSQIKMRRGKGLDVATNQMIEDAWSSWCRVSSCHVAGKLSFAEMQRMLMGAVAESGEVLVRKVYQPFGKSKIPFALEIIEADQLVDEWTGRTENGNEVRMGVEVDAWQRPVAYWLYPRHPGDYLFYPTNVQTNRYIRVPASEIYHLHVSDRPGATRGVPWMHAAMRRINNIGGTEEAEIVKVRAQAAIMGVIQKPELDNPTAGMDSSDGTDNYNNRLTELSAGTVHELAPGETFVGFDPSSPNPVLEPFLRYMLRAFCAGTGVSYESVSRDYSQSNYSSSRLALLDDRDNWRVMQQWFIDHFLQPVFDDWLDIAVLSNQVNLPDYEINRSRYESVRWMPRGWEWVDPLKEVKAAETAVRCGFSTLQDIIASKGGDYEDVYTQRKREFEMADEMELVFDTDSRVAKAGAQAQPVNDTNETETANNDSEQSTTDSESNQNDESNQS